MSNQVRKIQEFYRKHLLKFEFYNKKTIKSFKKQNKCETIKDKFTILLDDINCKDLLLKVNSLKLGLTKIASSNELKIDKNLLVKTPSFNIYTENDKNIKTKNTVLGEIVYYNEDVSISDNSICDKKSVISSKINEPKNYSSKNNFVVNQNETKISNFTLKTDKFLKLGNKLLEDKYHLKKSVNFNNLSNNKLEDYNKIDIGEETKNMNYLKVDFNHNKQTISNLKQVTMTSGNNLFSVDNFEVKTKSINTNEDLIEIKMIQ